MKHIKGRVNCLTMNNRNPSGFIHPHGMLHGLLTADEIDRGSVIISSKVFLHTHQSCFMCRFTLISVMAVHTLLNNYRKWLISLQLKWVLIQSIC